MIPALASDAFTHAADWLAFDPGAERVLRSDRATHAVARAIEALTDGAVIDIDAFAAEIGGPRIVAEALAAFIEWRIMPPTGALQ